MSPSSPSPDDARAAAERRAILARGVLRCDALREQDLAGWDPITHILFCTPAAPTIDLEPHPRSADYDLCAKEQRKDVRRARTSPSGAITGASAQSALWNACAET